MASSVAPARPQKRKRRPREEKSRLTDILGDVESALDEIDPLGEIQSSNPEPYFEYLDTKMGEHGSYALTRAIRLKESDAQFGIAVSRAKMVRPGKDKDGTVLLEGHRLIEEAILHKCTFKALYSSSAKSLKKFTHIPLDIPVYLVPGAVFSLYSDVETSQGVMAVIKIPKAEPVQAQSGPSLTLVLDNVADPGNVGTLIRSAAGLGCSRVLMNKGCVHCWSPKVVRAGMGAHLKVPIDHCLSYQSIFDAIRNSQLMIAQPAPRSLSDEADARPGDSGDILDVLKRSRLADTSLVIGNEGSGVSGELLDIIRTSEKPANFITIPMRNQVESLNAAVAGSIILFQLSRFLFGKV